MENEYIKNINMQRYIDGSIDELSDKIIVENWITLYLNGITLFESPVSVKEIKELIYGVLYIKSYIDEEDKEDIVEYIVEKSNAYISLHKHIEIKNYRDILDYFNEEADLYYNEIKKIEINKKFSINKILDLVNNFQELPSLYKETGGTHMAALVKNRIGLWAEDISRKNAFNKLIGKAYLEKKMPLDDRFIIFSGRISAELITKLINIKIPLIVSISAPTDKAIQLADKFGITICGFCRDNRMNIYTHKERLIIE